MVMVGVAFFRAIWEKYYVNNIYFPVQVLFAWAGFKILGWLKVALFLRLFLFLIFLIYLLFHSSVVFPVILNTSWFQLYLFSFYRLINLFIMKNWNSFVLGFILIFVAVFEVFAFEIKEVTIYFPSLDIGFFIITLFSFFYRFNKFVVIPSIAQGLIIRLSEKNNFHWIDLISLLNAFLKLDFHMSNSIKFVKPRALNFFPYSDNCLKALHELDLENLVKLSSQFVINRWESEKTPELLDKKIEGDILFNLIQHALDKDCISKEASKTALELNQKFYSKVMKGGVCGFFVLVMLLNSHIFLL